MSYDECLQDTIWSHWYESQRLESSVRRLLIAAERCQDELTTRRGVTEPQQAAPPAAQSRMI